MEPTGDESAIPDGALRLEFDTGQISLGHLLHGLRLIDELYASIVMESKPEDWIWSGGDKSPTVIRVHQGSPLALDVTGEAGAVVLMLWVLKHPRDLGAWPRRFLDGWRHPHGDGEGSRDTYLEWAETADDIVSALGELRRATVHNPSPEQRQILPPDSVDE